MRSFEIDNDYILDDYYICNLFQVNEDRGYVNKDKLNGILDHENMPFCHKIGKVIVKRSKSLIDNMYSLNEVLTDESIDTLYEWRVSNDLLIGCKKEYDTFILVPAEGRRVKLGLFNEYYEEHLDIEKYKNELIELKKQGKENHNNKKQAEQEFIKELVYKKSNNRE